MPLGPGIRYRIKTFPSGRRVRLAFRGKTVVETKPLLRALASHIRKRKHKKLTSFRKTK